MRRPRCARTGSPSGPRAMTPMIVPPTPLTSASSVPSPPSATGTISGCAPALSTPRAIATAASCAVRQPLNAFGATTTRIGSVPLMRDESVGGYPFARGPFSRAVGVTCRLPHDLTPVSVQGETDAYGSGERHLRLLVPRPTPVPLVGALLEELPRPGGHHARVRLALHRGRAPAERDRLRHRQHHR